MLWWSASSGTTRVTISTCQARPTPRPGSPRCCRPSGYRTSTYGCWCPHRDRCRPPPDRLIAEVGPLLRATGPNQLTFEFVLPWNLLAEGVETWCLDDGREIGNRSPVVVRSLDRLLDAWTSSEWERRSGMLRDSAVQPDELVQALGEQPPYQPSPNVACVAIGTKYVPPASWDTEHHLLTSLKEGVPVAIWYREGHNPQPLVDLLRDAARRGGIDPVPLEILRLRREGD